MWFECKIKYEKGDDSGAVKKVTETYLVQAVTHAEAEINFAREMAQTVTTDNEIVSVRRVKIEDMIVSPTVADTWWWKARVSYLTTDGRSGAERRQTYTKMVQGDDFSDAVQLLYDSLKHEMANSEVLSIVKSNIIDIIVSGEA